MAFISLLALELKLPLLGQLALVKEQLSLNKLDPLALEPLKNGCSDRWKIVITPNLYLWKFLFNYIPWWQKTRLLLHLWITLYSNLLLIDVVIPLSERWKSPILLKIIFLCRYLHSVSKSPNLLSNKLNTLSVKIILSWVGRLMVPGNYLCLLASASLCHQWRFLQKAV